MLTKRCRITPLKADDITKAAELYTESEVRRFLGGTISREAAMRKLEGYLSGRELGYYFCVTLRQSGELMGLIEITPYCENAETEISYQFFSAFWGRGYAQETLKAVLDYCRDILHLKRVVSETQCKNIRSRKLLERLGYRWSRELIRFGEPQAVYIYELSSKIDDIKR